MLNIEYISIGRGTHDETDKIEFTIDCEKVQQ